MPEYRPHIAFFTHRFTPDIGGVELSVFHTAKALSALGADITIFTETPGTRNEIGFGHIERFAIRRSWPLTRLRYWRFFYRRRQRLNEFDVLHFHDYGTFLNWFFPLRMIIRKPVYAMTFHGFDGWPILARHRAGRAVSAALMDITFGVGDYIQRFYGHRIDEVFLGAPVRERIPDGSSERNRFLFVGRLEPDTGIDRFIDCLREACDVSGIGAHLVCIGKGSLSADLQGRSGGPFSVDVYPPTLDTDGEMVKADFVVATGFLALMDAFQNRRTAIVPAFTPVKQAYIRSILSADELCFITADPETCVATLASLLTNPGSRAREMKKERAEDFVRSHTWRAIADLHLRAYSNKARTA